MYDWHVAVGAIAGILTVLAVIPYIKDILHGSTRPNIVSWSLWVLLLLIGVLGQISAGASWSLIFLIGDLIGTSFVLSLCIAGYGYKKYGWLEVVCFVLAIIAIVLWQLTNEPLIAIWLAVAADFLASIPTLVKAYMDPMSEAPLQFFIIAFASLLAVLSTAIFDYANLLFPVYLLLINASIGTTSFLRSRLTQEAV